MVAIGETAAVQDTDDCRSVVVDDVTYASFRIGRRGRIRSIFWPSLSIADQLAKAEWVVQRAQRDVEVAAEAEAIAEELAEAAQRAGKLRTDLRALTFLRLRLSGRVLGLAQAPAGYQGTPIDWAARLKALIAGE